MRDVAVRKASNTVYQARRKEQVATEVRRLKSGPCADCGEVHPHFVMDFDHREDKRWSIRDMMRRRHTLPAILREIAKCDLVCANCHRYRTEARAGRWP